MKCHLSTEFPLARSPPHNFPGTEGGGRRKKGCTSESGFAMPTERSSTRHSEANQELSDCKPSSISSMYNSRRKTWGYITVEPQEGGNHMLLNCTVRGVVQRQKTTGSSLSRPFATPHGPPHSVTHAGETPRLACLWGGCEGSRRCEWVIAHPSLLMSDALSPLASIPGFGGAPRHASRLKHQPPSRTFCTPGPRLPDSSHPHKTLWGRRLNFLKWRPRGLVVSCRRLYLCGTSRSSPLILIPQPKM